MGHALPFAVGLAFVVTGNVVGELWIDALGDAATIALIFSNLRKQGTTGWRWWQCSYCLRGFPNITSGIIGCCLSLVLCLLSISTIEGRAARLRVAHRVGSAGRV